MVFPRSVRVGIPLFAISLLVLLVGLAVLQYRWIEEIASAERDRARNLMRVSAERLAEDINRELMRVHLEFRPERGAIERPPLERYQRWRASATFPDLVEDVFIFEGGNVGKLDLSNGQMHPGQLPPPLAAELSHALGFGDTGPPMGPRRGPFLPEPLAFVVRAGAPSFRPDEPPRPPAILIITIDEAYLTSTVIPSLTKRHLPPSGSAPYALSVWKGNQRVFPQLAAQSAAEFAVPVLNFSELHEPPMERERFRGPGHRRPQGPRYGPEGDRPPADYGRPTDHSPPPRTPSLWRVEVSHPSGALDAVVARSKRRNLMVSGAILALLALALVLAMTAAAKATRTARQQMEFVASITHELNTPLAAIRSAAQNLSDGIIEDPERVQRYGATILQQESRLAAMISEALMFAGITARRWRKPEDQIVLPALINEAIAEVEASSGSTFRHELRIAPDLPNVRGDERLLRSAIRNLLQNAARHGASDAPVVVEARQEGGGVSITVLDGGPGIPAEELPRIFEPFFRGKEASRRSGAGLGLSIVKRVIEAHGGSVHASSSGAGTAMKVVLPSDV